MRPKYNAHESTPGEARTPGILIQVAIVLAICVPNMGSTSAAIWQGSVVILTGLMWFWLLVVGRSAHVTTPVVCLAIAFLAPLFSFRVDTARRAIWTVLTVLFLVALALMMGKLSQVAFERVLRTIVLLAVAQAGLAIAQAATGRYPTWGALGDQSRALVGSNELAPWLNEERAVGTMAHPIVVGLLCAIGATIACSPRFRLRLVGRVFAVTVLIAGILATGSRSAAIAVAIGATAAWTLGPAERILVSRRGRAHARPAGSGSSFRGTAGALLMSGAAATVVWHFDVLGSLSGSFSMSHRLNSIQGIENLMARPIHEILFGSGPDGVLYAYADGYIPFDGSTAIDNQFVWSFVVGGLFQVVAVGYLLLRAIARRAPLSSEFGLIFVVMGVTFDFLAWNAGMVLFVVFIFSPWIEKTNQQTEPASIGATEPHLVTRPQPSPGQLIREESIGAHRGSSL